MKIYFQQIFNLIFLFFTQNKKQNYFYFVEKVKQEFPRGMMVFHDGLEFFVKDYSALPNVRFEELDSDKNKLYIICEFFDPEDKKFKEKIFHEDFIRNRYKVQTGISNRG